MKRTISLFALVAFVTYSGFSTVRTVSNHPAGGSQFTTLQAGYNASANSGDTLLLEGTDDPYFLTCNSRWNKSIVVIGIGFNPDKQMPKRVKIRNIDCVGDFYLRPSGSGSRFYGIEFTSRVALEDNQGAFSNLVFENCLFTDVVFPGGTSCTNFTFTNCIFNKNNDLNMYFASNHSYTGVFNNCVFDGYIEGNSTPYLSVEFNHCLYLSTASTQIFNNVYYATIRNCIFMNRFPTGTFNSSYLNNICRVAGTFPPSPANGNSASGNIEATNPLLVICPAGEFYSTTHNYQLQSGSPAINSGNDGTNMGVDGGYTNFSRYGEVLINPIIRAMNILNTSVAPNGTLNVQLTAGTPHTD